MITAASNDRARVCNSELIIVVFLAMKLNAKELRVSKGDPDVYKKLKKNPVYIVLDNVLDTYNIGAIFRLADAVAAEKVILCGASETPPNHRIKKASINTTEWVAWEYFTTAKEAIESLRKQFSTPLEQYSSSDRPMDENREVGIQIIAVEQDPRSIPYDKVEYTFPVALVVGHETDGISKEVLDIADHIVELPMWGVNISLNVMVSLAIVLFQILEQKT